MRNFNLFLLSCALLLTFTESNGQPLRVAVAANAQGLIKKLKVDFKKRTGIGLETIIGASGKLSAQIMNGAPYDIFLSADREFPDKLYAAGYGLRKPGVYALGSLIVCHLNSNGLKDWRSVALSSSVKKIAVANADTAPYGRAAKECLEFYGLSDKLSQKLIVGESISQVNSYIQTANVEMAFTTESFLYDIPDKSGFVWTRIDQRSYGEIAQGAILLAYSTKKNAQNARKFYDYLFSAPAQKIIANSGYHLPNQH